MSQLNVDTIKDSTGADQPDIVGAAKAWVNFNGTGTVAIRDSFNVSSITDNGTGDYTVNFTNAMNDANYSWAGGIHDGTDPLVAARTCSGYTQSAGSVRFKTNSVNASAAVTLDYAYTMINVFAN